MEKIKEMMHSTNKLVKLLSGGIVCCLLSACPAAETAHDHADAANRKAQLASIDDTPWLVTGIQVVGADEKISIQSVSNDLNFVLRFDRTLGVAYGHDGCQFFEAPLRFRSGGLLSFDVSGLQANDCLDDALLRSQRNTILDLLSLVKDVRVPADDYRWTGHSLQLAEYAWVNSRKNFLLLEPANLTTLNHDPLIGVPLTDGELIQPTTLVSNDNDGLERAKVEVIRNRGAFDSAWGLQMVSDGGIAAVNNVDFATTTLVAATLGNQYKSGFQIAMTRSEVIDGEIKVALKMTAPHPSCSANREESTPAAIFSLPTRSRLLSVSTVEQFESPCSNETSLAAQNLSIRTLDDTSITLNWDQPTGYSDTYRVSAHSGQTTLSDNGQATLQGLTPGIRHQIVIAPTSSDSNLDTVTAFVTTRMHTPEQAKLPTQSFDAFELNKTYVSESESIAVPITNTFSNQCGERQAMGLDLSPSECARSSLTSSLPFSEWRTNSTVTEDQSVGYHMDRKGRLFISRHNATLSNSSEHPIGILESKQCIEPSIEGATFICAN